MTALYLDGFDHYGSGKTGPLNMLDGAWAEVQPNGTIGTPAWGARTGTFSLMTQTFNGDYRYVLPATKTRIFASMGFSVDGLPTADFRNQICSFRSSSNAVIANLWVQSTGAIVLADGSNNPLAETQGPIIVSRKWHFIEFDFNPTGGSFVLRVDDSAASGTPVINASGLSFSSATVAQITVLGQAVASSGQTVSWCDDLFIRDTAGSVNNSWIGDMRVATLFADADVPTPAWDGRYYEMLGAGILNNTDMNGGVWSPPSSSLNIGAGDFTIEAFVRFQSLPTGTNPAVIFGCWDSANNQRQYQLFLGSVALNGGALCFQTSADGTQSTVQQPIVYPWTPELDTWYHVAIVRASSELLLFVNGQQLGLPIADSRTYFAGASALGIGGQTFGPGTGSPGFTAGTYLTGWLDEVRFTNGFARYTANFTPTTVEFPRGSGDPQWADVALLCGFDSLIQDESSFGRRLSANTIVGNCAIQQAVFDGPAVGLWSTIGKPTPDDNTFAEAPFLPATSILTLSAQPANGDHVTVGTKDGTVAAVYTFKTALASAFDVLIDTSLQQTLQNLNNAINAGAGAGTKYGTGTTSNFDVTASQLPAGQMEVTANRAGTSGNSIATSASLTNGGGWTGATLSGGTNIPSPSDFKVQRPPALTTIISAVQLTQRTFKSDSGLCTVTGSFIGPLGTVATGATHSPGVSPDYFSDIFETDPDTSAPISPATIINGRIRLNRVT